MGGEVKDFNSTLFLLGSGVLLIASASTSSSVCFLFCGFVRGRSNTKKGTAVDSKVGVVARGVITEGLEPKDTKETGDVIGGTHVLLTVLPVLCWLSEVIIEQGRALGMLGAVEVGVTCVTCVG